MWPGRDPQPWKVSKWVLIDRLHWTEAEADDLTAAGYFEGMAVLDALDKVTAARNNKGGSQD